MKSIPKQIVSGVLYSILIAIVLSPFYMALLEALRGDAVILGVLIWIVCALVSVVLVLLFPFVWEWCHTKEAE